ncbi:MAG: hypothetical protein P8103_20095 [Candidatus Thiodiazotropha sp.]
MIPKSMPAQPVREVSELVNEIIVIEQRGMEDLYVDRFVIAEIQRIVNLAIGSFGILSAEFEAWYIQWASPPCAVACFVLNGATG